MSRNRVVVTKLIASFPPRVAFRLHHLDVGDPPSGLEIVSMKAQKVTFPDMTDLTSTSDMVTVGDLPTRSSYRIAKRVLDIVLSSAALVVLCPVILIIWLAVRSDGGPGFFGHKRIGRDRAEFSCLKFRTMVVNAEAALSDLLARDPVAAEQWQRTRKLTNDPRVTRLGRVLRATSLDELPQLLNIIRGDMSLVGPRPVVDRELSEYYRSEGRRAYLSVRPGLTGLWQVSGRSRASYEMRVQLDTRYVREASLLLDAVIIARTAAAVLLQKGAY